MNVHAAFFQQIRGTHAASQRYPYHSKIDAKIIQVLDELIDCAYSTMNHNFSLLL